MARKVRKLHGKKTAQELALLRSQAESLLFDAEFPSDPFHDPGPR